jgi:hypothetical protein
VLIEFRREGRSGPIESSRGTSETQTMGQMAAAGLARERSENILPGQHFMVSRRP